MKNWRKTLAISVKYDLILLADRFEGAGQGQQGDHGWFSLRFISCRSTESGGRRGFHYRSASKERNKKCTAPIKSLLFHNGSDVHAAGAPRLQLLELRGGDSF